MAPLHWRTQLMKKGSSIIDLEKEHMIIDELNQKALKISNAVLVPSNISEIKIKNTFRQYLCEALKIKLNWNSKQQRNRGSKCILRSQLVTILGRKALFKKEEIP